MYMDIYIYYVYMRCTTILGITGHFWNRFSATKQGIAENLVLKENSFLKASFSHKVHASSLLQAFQGVFEGVLL